MSQICLDFSIDCRNSLSREIPSFRENLWSHAASTLSYLRFRIRTMHMHRDRPSIRETRIHSKDFCRLSSSWLTASLLSARKSLEQWLCSNRLRTKSAQWFATYRCASIIFCHRTRSRWGTSARETTQMTTLITKSGSANCIGDAWQSKRFWIPL